MKQEKKLLRKQKAQNLIFKSKIILKSVRQYKKYAFLSPLCMIGEALMECLIPFHMSMFLNILEEMGKTGDFKFTAGLIGFICAFIGMTILSVVCGIFGGIFASKASTGLATNLRSDIYKKIESFSFGNIDKFSVSSLITRMTTDVSNIQMAFQMMIRIVIRAPLMLIFSAIMAFVTGGNMAWIFVALIPIVVAGFAFIIYNAMKIFKKVFKRYDTLNESVQENVSGIRVVKSYVREEYEQDKFNAASDSMTIEFVKAEKIAALSIPLMNTVIHVSNILVLGIGATLILNQKKAGIIDGLTVGQLSALITYGIQILSSLMMMSMILIMFTMSLEGIDRVGEVLLEESLIKNPENPVYEVKNGDVYFDNVCFKYFKDAEKNTLTDINLVIRSGQMVGILGPTGSGKTSIVNLISRLYDVSEGSVSVAGVDVRNYDLKTLRDNVAVVLQKNVLFSGTIEENLRWGNQDATMEEIEEACKIAQADEFIKQLPEGYQTHIEQGGTNVSGGQKQRLCIARAILKKPKILILDDSTSAVDTKTDSLIRKGLKEVIPETTKIIIAQRVSSVEDADLILIVDNGIIKYIGNHKTLMMESPSYKELWAAQNKMKGGK